VNSGGAPTISASVEKNIHVAEKEDPKILVHLTSPTTKNSCSFGALSDSRSAKVNGNLSGPAGPYYFLYILASPGVSFPIASMGGVQFGVSYRGQDTSGPIQEGIDVFSWTLCGILEFPSGGWPAPAGNIITWDRDHCQVGTTAVAGYFYVGAYSPESFRLIQRPVDGFAKVADCSAREYDLDSSALGYAVFGQSALGCNPWTSDCSDVLPIPVRITTWSGIKTLLNAPR
jgi:hypothetical protein